MASPKPAATGEEKEKAEATIKVRRTTHRRFMARAVLSSMSASDYLEVLMDKVPVPGEHLDFLSPGRKKRKDE